MVQEESIMAKILEGTTELQEAQALFEHRHDDGEWSEEQVHIESRPARTAVVSCRLPINEFLILEKLARASRESVSQFVKKAVEYRLSIQGVVPFTTSAASRPRILIDQPAPVQNLSPDRAQITDNSRPQLEALVTLP